MSAWNFLTPEQKGVILWERLIEKVPISQIWDKHVVNESVIESNSIRLLRKTELCREATQSPQ